MNFSLDNCSSSQEAISSQITEVKIKIERKFSFIALHVEFN